MTDIKFPCDTCICVPVCRHKLYGQLIENCKLLSLYFGTNVERKGHILYVHNNYHVPFRCLVESYLKPTRWSVDDEGQFITDVWVREVSNS